jgi:hypothetical protein
MSIRDWNKEILFLSSILCECTKYKRFYKEEGEGEEEAAAAAA